MTSENPTIAIIVASTRTKRFADAPLTWMLKRFSARTDFAVELLDLRENVLPFYDSPVPPARAPRTYYTDTEREVGEILDRADGYLILTNEYNHGYTGALKNLLDHFLVEFRRKPVAFVAYGNVGGSRAVEQLRLVAAELEMVSARHAVHIMGPQIMQIMQDPASAPEVLAGYEDRLDQVVGDLLWWTDALAVAREKDAAEASTAA